MKEHQKSIFEYVWSFLCIMPARHLFVAPVVSTSNHVVSKPIRHSENVQGADGWQLTRPNKKYTKQLIAELSYAPPNFPCWMSSVLTNEQSVSYWMGNGRNVRLFLVSVCLTTSRDRWLIIPLLITHLYLLYHKLQYFGLIPNRICKSPVRTSCSLSTLVLHPNQI